MPLQCSHKRRRKKTDLLEDLHEDDVELVEEEFLRLHARLVLGDVHHLPHDVVLDPFPLLRRQDLPPVWCVGTVHAMVNQFTSPLNKSWRWLQAAVGGCRHNPQNRYELTAS